MNIILYIILALALSVPLGTALAAFGALALEFLLGSLVEAGQTLEEDPVKRKWLYAGLAALLALVLLCVLLACAGGALLLWRTTLQ